MAILISFSAFSWNWIALAQAVWQSFLLLGPAGCFSVLSSFPDKFLSVEWYHNRRSHQHDLSSQTSFPFVNGWLLFCGNLASKLFCKKFLLPCCQMGKLLFSFRGFFYFFGLIFVSSSVVRRVFYFPVPATYFFVTLSASRELDN